MNGIQFITDAKGRKKAAIIDLFHRGCPTLIALFWR